MAYSIALWDHEIEPEGDFSEALAAEHLGGPSRGLSIPELRKALRVLYGRSWDRHSILVEQETP